MTYADINPVETWVKPMKDENGNFDFTEVDRAQSRNYIQGSKISMVRVITPAGTSAQEVRVTDGTDDLVINADGSLNVISSGVSLSFATNSTVASNNTQTIYTAPAGGTKIYGITLATNSTNGGIGTSYLTVAGNRYMSHSMTNASTPAEMQTTTQDFGNNYIALTNGQTVTVTTSALAIDAYANIVYKDN